MAVVPPSNLPPESQPWARDRDAAISQLQFDVAKNAQTTDNSFTAVNNALNTNANQIAAINAQNVTIAAQNATILTQQASINAQLTSINALIAAQVDGATGTNSASPTLTTTPGGYAAITFTVPAGYTRAKVMGVSAMYMGGTVASILRTQINGVNGPDMFAFTNAAYANATAVNAASLTGLVGGGTFTVQAVANTSTGSTSGVINTAAIVTWLK